MRHVLNRLARDESGATAIEYGLIASLIFVVVAGSIAALGGANGGLFAKVGDTVVPALDRANGEGEGSGSPEGGDTPPG